MEENIVHRCCKREDAKDTNATIITTERHLEVLYYFIRSVIIISSFGVFVYYISSIQLVYIILLDKTTQQQRALPRN